MQKYNLSKEYNFLKMVPPWSNNHIRTKNEIHSVETLAHELIGHVSFPQTFDTFHDFDSLVKVLHETENGNGLKILGRIYDFVSGQKIDMQFKGSFSFETLIGLENFQFRLAVENWLSKCKISNHLMGLPVKLCVDMKSIKVSRAETSNKSFRINYSFSAWVVTSSPIYAGQIENYDDIVEFPQRQSTRGEKLDYFRWKLLLVLATYGKAINVQKFYLEKKFPNFILYRPIANYREKLLKFRLTRPFLAKRDLWSYLSIVPLAINSGYGKNFMEFYKTYGNENFSCDMMKEWTIRNQKLKEISFRFWLKEGPLDVTLKSLSAIKKSLANDWHEEYSIFTKDYCFSVENRSVKVFFWDDNKDEKFKKIKADLLDFCDSYAKFLKKLYKRESRTKITCYDIAQRLATAYCERIRKNPKLFIDSPMDLVANYARSLLP